MANLTKQDIQNIVENAKNRVLERVVTRQDVQCQTDLMKLMYTNLQQALQLVRQSEYQRVQMSRQIASLEGKLMQMDQELRQLKSATQKLADSKPERIIMPIQAENSHTPENRYLYNPNPA